MSTITLSPEALREKLAQITHAQPVTFSALVDVEARKTGNPYGEIRKLSQVNAFTGFDYENSVNRQLGREKKDENFVADARKWGERIGPALVQKAGNYYLVCKIERTRKPIYMVRGPKFLQVIAKEKIAHLLPPPSVARNQGCDKQVIYRNYSLNNIKQISFGGAKYKVR